MKELFIIDSVVKGILYIQYSDNIRINGCLINILDICEVNSIDIKDTSVNLSIRSVKNHDVFSAQNKFILDHVTFKQAPEISGIKFTNHNVNIQNVTFDDMTSGEAIGAFRGFKKACEDAHYEHGAILFHGFELEAYYNAHLKGKWNSDIPEKISSKIHKWVTDYGRNVMRPLWWLLGIFIFCGLFYMFSGGILYLVLGDYFLLSLKKTLGPFAYALPTDSLKNIKPINSLQSIISFFQVILSSLIWFLIVFMIRRRFKL